MASTVFGKRIDVAPPKKDPTDSGWYLAAGPELPYNTLRGEVTCECLVIGAGWMGLHAARRYAELNPSAHVVLVDAGRIGNNASGRCLGFAIDLAHNPRKRDFIEDVKGNNEEYHVNLEGTAYLKSWVDMGVDCDWDPQGKYHSAATDHGVADLMNFSKALDRMGQKYRWVEKNEMQDLTGSKHYIKGLFHPGTVLLQPAKYLMNAARMMPKNVTVYENTIVNTATFGKPQHVFQTQGGVIRARKVILCTAGYLNNFGFFPKSAIPVYTFASMTRVLTEKELAGVGHGPFGLIPANSFGTTVRRTTDNRLIFRNVYAYAKGHNVGTAEIYNAREYQKLSFDRRYPELTKIGFEHSWGGMLTLAQNGGMAWGELAENVYSSSFCNGTGVSRGSAFGKAIAELASGMSSETIEILKRRAKPSRAYPELITEFGVNYVTGKRFKEAGEEI
ncbi:FAD-binding oxidoreductase [Pseudomonas sp. CC120222-01a]|uniref:NAD(P)/FAD-dependent oxidoreductase n=1 Tax=Pseudomonas sp. CC120222-01a TaxID=1378075 RepID=UPI000D9E82F2|nr:FAD-binding oxidoreductase [Pseudomonas sp. CC120222-01a]PVZ41207.1 glycine/D-amino acid oxidase-like deaminating enzyme [Pseudomonas sp. CC120222-01a]